MNVTTIIKQSFERLKDKRFFVSEADFQHAFGMELLKSFADDKNTQIIMEFPVTQNGRIIYIDIMIVKDGDFYPIELKYGVKKIDSDALYENTNIPIRDMLKNQDAQDLNEYGFWKDIKRIETFQEISPRVKSGVCIFIANDAKYWDDFLHIKETGSHCFRITPGKKLSGIRQWENNTESRKKNCPEFNIKNNYEFEWNDFYKTSYKNGIFKSLFVEIPKKQAN